MSDDRRRTTDWGDWHIPAVISLAALLCCLVWAAMLGAEVWSGAKKVSGGPFAAVLALALKQVPWPGLPADVILAAELAVLAGLLWAGLRIYSSWGSRNRVDRAARHLGRGRDLAAYTDSGVRESAQRLRHAGAGPDPAEHGMFLGDTVTGPSKSLRMDWEGTATLIAGPRRGKTMSFVIRQLIEAPGPAVATSVRRDVYDATVDIRARWGTCWNFDPQHLITDATPGFWIDPFDTVRTTDDAAVLAGHFAAATRGSAVTINPDYFDIEGEHLLAGLLFAASFKPPGRRSLLDVVAWLGRADATEPIMLLENAHQPHAAEALNQIRTIDADPQRVGVYGFARSLLSCLENPDTLAWVTPPPSGAYRPRFDAEQFVASRDTLYLHAEAETKLTALVALLVHAVQDAARRRARRSPGGRLDPPLLSLLDEAGNICLLRSLPAGYSTFGGFGMPTLTVLQSREQGRKVWGKDGFEQLWGASTARIYGGNVADTEFLASFSSLLGEYPEQVASTSRDSYGRNSTSYTTQWRPIMTVADLVEMPRGRAVVSLAGARSAIIRYIPWTETAWAPAIHASIARNNPATATVPGAPPGTPPGWPHGPGPNQPPPWKGRS